MIISPVQIFKIYSSNSIFYMILIIFFFHSASFILSFFSLYDYQTIRT